MEINSVDYIELTLPPVYCTRIRQFVGERPTGRVNEEEGRVKRGYRSWQATG